MTPCEYTWQNIAINMITYSTYSMAFGSGAGRHCKNRDIIYSIRQAITSLPPNVLALHCLCTKVVNAPCNS